MPWSKQVFSEMVSEISYDEETTEMIVTWKKSGKRSAYANVPEQVAVECSNAPSVGQYINSEIKPAHSHRYV